MADEFMPEGFMQGGEPGSEDIEEVGAEDETEDEKETEGEDEEI
jgi:hypothetical protein